MGSHHLFVFLPVYANLRIFIFVSSDNPNYIFILFFVKSFIIKITFILSKYLFAAFHPTLVLRFLTLTVFFFIWVISLMRSFKDHSNFRHISHLLFYVTFSIR